MQVSPYIFFNGRCEEAFRFYERCLGGALVAKNTYGESPMGKTTPPEWAGKIMHARLEMGNQFLLGSDMMPEQYRKPDGFSVAIMVKDADEGERVFKALAENGTVQMPMQKTFWSAGFGMLVDQFGIAWMVNTEPTP